MNTVKAQPAGQTAGGEAEKSARTLFSDSIVTYKPLAFNRQIRIVDILTELGAALESGV